MVGFIKKDGKEKIDFRKYKQKDNEFLAQLQKFLDITDNIPNEELRLEVVYQMLKCDEILTKIAERILEQEV